MLCYRWLGRYFTFELSLKEGHQLITDGPYAYVRHPSYAGITAVLAGMIFSGIGGGSWFLECGLWKSSVAWGTLGTGWAIFYVVVAVLLLLRVPKEDQVMRNQFKGQWDEWAKRTPYRVIPFVY